MFGKMLQVFDKDRTNPDQDGITGHNWATQSGGSAASRLNLETSLSVWLNNQTAGDMRFESLRTRNEFWQQQARRISVYPVEFLLPRVKIDYKNVLPPSMLRAEDAFRRDPDGPHRLKKFDWGYFFYLGGGHSTKENEAGVNVARALSLIRFQAINDVIEAILGRDISKSTLIDFASNWGGFAIDMAVRGMKECVGFDIRPGNVTKASALAEYLDVPNARFYQCDVYEAQNRFKQQYDVVYNLGLLYHVMDPFSLMKATFDMCGRIAVVDTLATREPFSGFLSNSVITSPQAGHAKGFHSLELRPTYRGLIDLMSAVGFKDLMEITVELGDEFPKGKARDVFRQYHRRMIIGFK